MAGHVNRPFVSGAGAAAGGSDCALPNWFLIEWASRTSYFIAGRGSQARTKAMASAADYRKLAEECFEWAREARDLGVREHYAKLGQIWLECAARTELRSGRIASPQRTIAQKVA
jgi:hypothetical protein